jgi:hypothetical protein
MKKLTPNEIAFGLVEGKEYGVGSQNLSKEIRLGIFQGYKVDPTNKWVRAVFHPIYSTSTEGLAVYKIDTGYFNTLYDIYEPFEP